MYTVMSAGGGVINVGMAMNMRECVVHYPDGKKIIVIFDLI